MARRFGIATRDITLLLIGGVARLERIPDKPVEQMWVALAGPAANVALVGLLYAWLLATADWQPLTALTETEGAFLRRLLIVNVSLSGFNLLPSFPMDGGRVLRALATRMEYIRATQRAASIGQCMALGFGFLGLLGNPFLLFIAFFVWIGVAQEASLAQISSALVGIPVGRAMVTELRTLTAHDTAGHAVERLQTCACCVRGTAAHDQFSVNHEHALISSIVDTDSATVRRYTEAAMATVKPDTEALLNRPHTGNVRLDNPTAAARCTSSSGFVAPVGTTLRTT